MIRFLFNIFIEDKYVEPCESTGPSLLETALQFGIALLIKSHSVGEMTQFTHKPLWKTCQAINMNARGEREGTLQGMSARLLQPGFFQAGA